MVQFLHRAACSGEYFAKKIEDEVIYYDIKISKLNYIKSVILELIESMTKATAEGLSNAFSTKPLYLLLRLMISEINKASYFLKKTGNCVT